MRKYVLRFGLFRTLTFLVLCIYFYKTSGNFRKSIITALISTIIFFSNSGCQAAEVDPFTPQVQYQTRPSRHSNIFSGRSSSGSGPGKPDNFDSESDENDLSQFPKTESVEKTEGRIEKIDEYIRQISEMTNSDTESENECTATVTLMLTHHITQRQLRFVTAIERNLLIQR